VRILFLDLDTLRPDHLGCYGYPRNTSPNIDEVARRGVRLDNYYCSNAPCLPARAALITGQFGIRSGIVGHGGTAADLRLDGRSRGFRSALDRHSLWSFLRAQGLRTASVSSFPERHSAWWFNAGLTEWLNPGRGGMDSAEEVTPLALDWLERNARCDSWVLHVNYWDPHTPYRAPAEFGNPFADEPVPEWMTQEVLDKHRSLPGGHGARELNMWNDHAPPQYPRHPGQVETMDDFRRMIDGYDCGTRYMDGHIGMLLNTLADADVLDDTAIVVTSDHGECLGELKCYGEHGTSDYVTHRIPMIVAWPGCRTGHADKGLHYNLDLGPTLADLLGQPPRPEWQGASYAQTLKSGADCGREHLVLEQSCHGAMRSVRFGPWIYIRVIHDFYHLYPREMLFNVEEDPHEQHDLAEQRGDVRDRAARLMLDWHDDMMSRLPDAVDPLWTVMREGGPLHSRGQLRAYCERLVATGRGEHVQALKARHPDEFSAPGGR